MIRPTCAGLSCLLIIGACFRPSLCQAQLGELLWEEEFNTLDNWLTETGNGAWGWGNGELQFYQAANVQTVELAEEPGNRALRITALAQSGPGIVDQWGNPLSYTSGRVNTKSKVTVRYGMIEARVRVPDLELGGWPALWLLGTSNLAWPRKGELDLMEMGHHRDFRNLHDTHNGGDGSDQSSVNEMVSSNAIFYSDAAVSPENPSGGNSISWDPDDSYCRPWYNRANPLNDRWLVYRLYWDETSLRYTVVDNGEEHDLFASPFILDEVSAELRQPFYFIANLAVGGALTDCYRLGDTGSGLPVSLPLPAHLELDYIRVYRWNGQGEVVLGPPAAHSGDFGVFTDTTPVDGQLVLGETADVFVWEGTLAEGDQAPFEGEQVLSWTTTGAGWFGAGILPLQPLNLLNFAAGELRFRIRIPAAVTFKVGILDSWGNQSWVEFPANQTRYGLVRNGEWGQVILPVDELRSPQMDLRMLQYAFAILEEHGTPCALALDDIVYTGGSGATVAEPVLPATPQLKGNWPNPFNPATTIRYDLPRAAQVHLGLFNLAGQEVATLVDGAQGAGAHEAVWQAAGVASGIYLVRLQVDREILTGKCLLVK